MPLQLVGIVNLTEDSFSDGGRHLEPQAAIAHARALARDGADWIELGPASSHPDARIVPAREQIARLEPVLVALREARIPVSVDATDPAVLRFALESRVALLNDVRGFADPALHPALADGDCELVVVHSVLGAERASRTAGLSPDQVVEAIERFFEARLAQLVGAGVSETRILLDPGMGFFLGPDPETSLRVLRALPRLRARLGRPLFVSVSRKSFLRAVSGRRVEDVGAATLAAELYAALQGADYLRTHDVRALADALAVLRSLDPRGALPFPPLSG
jgi:dihydropteroate synthase type 2